MNIWTEYIEYLKSWAEEHSDSSFAGMSPAGYYEWLDNDANNWICPECGNPTETVQTISEWCDDFGLECIDELYAKADELNYASDICESCFKKILSSIGLI